MSNDRAKKFPAPTGDLVFFRTYSHLVNGHRETWEEVCNRAIQGLAELGKLTQEEIDLIYKMAIDYKAMPSGRWLWVGGRDWVKNPENFSGAYNCTSTNIVDVKSFALMMSLAMMGSGTGAVLSETCISQLPPVCNKITVKIIREIGEVAPEDRKEKTTFERIEGDRFLLTVGDSREGWASSYNYLILAAMSEAFTGFVNLEIDLGNVRPAGEKLKGFGGVANPVKLPGLYERCAAILNKAVGRKLTSVECCLLIDEAAVVVVAGNVRRSAGMRQADSDDRAFASAKDNLWIKDEEDNWRIDPERDALRMANHTRVFHHKPSLEEVTESVRKQYYSGEGAIQWAGEAIARANADLLPDGQTKRQFIQAYQDGWGGAFLKKLGGDRISLEEVEDRLQRFGLNPCGC
jgi:ribonucleotide reductase, class II